VHDGTLQFGLCPSLYAPCGVLGASTFTMTITNSVAVPGPIVGAGLPGLLLAVSVSAGAAGGDARGNNSGPSPGQLCDARAAVSTGWQAGWRGRTHGALLPVRFLVGQGRRNLM
jgi:hypothetical protein